MGEIAEMMLEGDLCEGCGVYMGGPGQGFPRRCASCRKDERAMKHAAVLAQHQQIKKVPCPACGKKVKACGLADHQRDAHGVLASDAGQQLVPVKPTTEMLNAGAMRIAMNAQYVATAESKAEAVWRDMLRAAPGAKGLDRG